MPRRGSLATISNLHKSSIPCVSFTAVAAVASTGLSVGDCEPFVKDEMSFLDSSMCGRVRWIMTFLTRGYIIKVCIIRLDHICFEKSSSTF